MLMRVHALVPEGTIAYVCVHVYGPTAQQHAADYTAVYYTGKRGDR
jgi:hypothetical protein